MQEPVPALRKLHRSKDGAVYIYDATKKSWRLHSVPKPEGSLVVAGAQAALPWAQFDVRFNGDFVVAGRSLLLGERKLLRPEGEQVHGDTGRSVWDGAVALSKVLEHNTQLIEGRRVLELGAGRGIVGLSASLLGARRVTLTDLEYCLETLQEGVLLNGLAGESCAHDASALREGPNVSSISVAELDWSEPEKFFLRRDGEKAYDVVLAADVVWLLELVEPLVRTFRTICENSSAAEVLVVHQTRSRTVEAAFLAAMATASFEVMWELKGGSLDASEGTARGAAIGWHPDYVPDARIRLWSFRRASPGQ
eukprot:CAMPEP_0171101066 /NCGR_PEP_ID=MMETSP0766_2-20121228/53885_1 /TAXON_ID=439317 /ORGANISM="Gambierdiscus australes, Strain CAWD 149" /LENGTH=308 /DNA_ID=CAMNT_0011561023 /DNA_START=136 /DNA_END=1062 /DNA_ORIENTATION=+